VKYWQSAEFWQRSRQFWPLFASTVLVFRERAHSPGRKQNSSSEGGLWQIPWGKNN